MANAAFIRYFMVGPTKNFYWWDKVARTYLESQDWHLLDSSSFDYTKSYG